MSSVTTTLNLEPEEVEFCLYDAVIKRHLTAVAATAVVIQAMARGMDRDWALSHGVPAGKNGKAINARISDARRLLKARGIVTDLPAHPGESEQIQGLLRTLQGLRRAA